MERVQWISSTKKFVVTGYMRPGAEVSGIE